MDPLVGVQSVYEWLASLGLTKYYPLFAGYDGVDAVRHLREADLVRVGITSARDRRKMIQDIEERNLNGPLLQRTLTGSSFSHGRSMSQPTLAPPTANGGKRKFSKGTLFKPKGPMKAGADNDKSPNRPPGVTDGLLLQHQPWFHGRITRKAAEKAVSRNGDILARESISKPGEIVLTVRWKGQALHYVVEKLAGATVTPPTPTNSSSAGKGRTQSLPSEKPLYRVGGDTLPSVVDLVNHHLRSKQPVSQVSGALALFAVSRAATHKPGDTVSLTSGGDSRRNSVNMDDFSRDSPTPDLLSLQSIDLFHAARAGSSPAVLSSSVMDRGSSSSLSTLGLNHRSGSVSSLTSAASSRSPDLPDADLLEAMCNVVFKYSPFDLAQHMMRVNMQMAVLLPKGLVNGLNGNSDLSHLSENQELDLKVAVNLPAGDLEELRRMHGQWQAGKVSGLAVVNLEQGRTLAECLLHRFKSLSTWTAAVVIGSGDVNRRCAALRRMVEVAQCLQSDALADLFGFMAVMRGLEMPAVNHLTDTWEKFHNQESGTAALYFTQLCGLADSLRSGQLGHEHLTPSLPYLEPLLAAMAHPLCENSVPSLYEWEEKVDSFSLDALVSHLDAGRLLCVQSEAHRLAGLARLHGVKVNTALEEYFKRDFPLLLFLSRPCQMTGEPTPELLCTMLDLMSTTAECKTIIGKNTMI